MSSPSQLPFETFKLLSFDIYGTLIDWESGIVKTLSEAGPFKQLSPSHPALSRSTILTAWERNERRIQSETPDMKATRVHELCFLGVLNEILASSDKEGSEISAEQKRELEDACANIDKEAEAARFAQRVGEWPAFADTVAAMQSLAKHYKLIPLSNIDRASFSQTTGGPLRDVPFAAKYLAEDIGSYKPDLRNFEYLIDKVRSQFGVEKEQILHVAQSLFHDHIPAEKMGLKHVWVDRKGLMGNEGAVKKEIQDSGEEARWDLRVDTLGELAEIVEKAWKG
jgi:2-haloalkanoic acid dehalogenase type II